jgi:hypothetical protein
VAVHLLVGTDGEQQITVGGDSGELAAEAFGGLRRMVLWLTRKRIRAE